MSDGLSTAGAHGHVSDAFVPLSVPVLSGNELAYVTDCVRTGWVSSAGSYVDRFEEMIREATGASHAVACQSGTAGLHVALLLHGVGAGDAVICPALTFIATCNAIAYTGARPVFMDCDDFMNLDPAKMEAYLTRECDHGPDGLPVDRQTGLTVRAVLPVHVFGNPCDMALLSAIARAHGLAVIEDACESLGSSWSSGPLDGRHTGTAGHVGVFSFNGNKIVTCGGGGCLVTDDESLAVRARHLTTTAKSDAVRFVHDEVGYNYRLTNLCAALGVAQLEQLPVFLETKRRNHGLYAEGFRGAPGLTFLGTPGGTAPNHWFYSLLVEPDIAGIDREGLMEHLDSKGIQTRPVWQLNHRQAPYVNDRAYEVERAEWFWQRVLNLPSSSDLAAADVERIVGEVLAATPEGSA